MHTVEHLIPSNQALLRTLITHPERTDLPALILINGGPGCADYLEPVAALLTGIACAIRFDPRGCGRSTNSSGEITIATSIDDLESIRVALNVETWFVLGHSFGANIALAYALAHPARTQALIALAGGILFTDKDWHAQYQARRSAPEEADFAAAHAADPEINRQLNRSWSEFARQPELLKRLATLDTPTLFICGDNDPRPDWPIRQLANFLPRADFVSVPDAGHAIWRTHADTLIHHIAARMRQL